MFKKIKQTITSVLNSFGEADEIKQIRKQGQVNTKQVIVMRRYYPDVSDPTKQRKLRTGKLIAQACHASISFLTRNSTLGGAYSHRLTRSELEPSQVEWLKTSARKVVCYVNTEKEILNIQQEATKLGLENHLIIDSGYTEFNLLPTITCIALGPDLDENLDIITKNLPLL